MHCAPPPSPDIPHSQGEDHPIVPVMLGDARLAAEFADEMLEKGIYVIGFSYPVVPRGESCNDLILLGTSMKV